MKPAGQAFFKKIAQDTPCAIGPATGLEARLDHRDEHGFQNLVRFDRVGKPGVKPERETSRTWHSRLTRQIWRCLTMKAMKANFKTPPSQKTTAFLRISLAARKRATSSFKAAVSATSAHIFQWCSFQAAQWVGIEVGYPYLLEMQNRRSVMH